MYNEICNEKMARITQKKTKKGTCLYLNWKEGSARKQESLKLFLTGDKATDKATMAYADQKRIEKELELAQGKVTKKIPTLLDYYDQVYKQRRVTEKLSFNTTLKWKNTRIKLVKYLTQEGIMDIRLDELSISFLKGFQAWLTTSNDHSHKVNEMKPTSVNIVTSKLMSVLREATKNDLVKPSISSCDIKMREDKPRVDYLTDEEIQKVMDNDWSVPYVHQSFRLQLLTGLRIGDVCNLKKTDVVDKEYIEITQEKTQTPVIIPISAKAKALIAELVALYPDSEELIPKLRHYKDELNRQLKRWFKELGIDACKAHTHVARHSFASALVRREESIFLISKLVGHSNVATTEKYYAKADKETLKKVIDRL